MQLLQQVQLFTQYWLIHFQFAQFFGKHFCYNLQLLLGSSQYFSGKIIITPGTGTVLEREFLCVKKFCLRRTALRSVCVSAPEQLAQMQRYKSEPYPTLKLSPVSLADCSRKNMKVRGSDANHSSSLPSLHAVGCGRCKLNNSSLLGPGKAWIYWVTHALP